MSYQLEREIIDRVANYHDQAARERAIPRSGLRRRIAGALRAMADRIESRGLANGFTIEQRDALLQGRNQ